MTRGESGTGASEGASWSPMRIAVLAVLFAVLGAMLYRPSLEGGFLSDDYGYIVTNAYTSELSQDNVLAILDPTGPAKFYTANYAPVHLLLHALEQHIFADDVRGYHLVNVLVHAVNSALLVALLLTSGIPAAGALLGGLFFAVHPANVEAVAWISQLKTNGALALSLGALLAHRRRPGLGALLFALALLTKASAVAALPAAAIFTWARSTRARRSGTGGSPKHWAWLGLWGLIFALYSIPQFASFQHLGRVDIPAYDDRLLHARTIVAVGMRYLVMAATSYGVSAFQEPLPVSSWLDPWWLLGLPLGGLLAWRTLATLRSGREEAGYWVFAASSFVLVSQLFPFVHPVADRYLYFILPGLIGGVLLLGMEVGRGLAAASASGRSSLLLARGAVVAALLLATFFGMRSWERARLWRNETWLLIDAAVHYPDGGTARFLRARRAAQEGDVDTAVAELRAAVERGIDGFSQIMSDPGLAPLGQAPAFVELVQEVAGRWIERAQRRGYSTQAELRMMSHAHLVREEYAEAIAALEGAMRAGGPLDSVVRAELEAVRGAQAHGVRAQ